MTLPTACLSELMQFALDSSELQWTKIQIPIWLQDKHASKIPVYKIWD